MHCGSSQWVRRSTGSGSVVLLCGQTHTHTHSGVICIGSSQVLLLKAAHCVLHPPLPSLCDNVFKDLDHSWGSCDFEYPITNRHETDTMTRTPSHIYMSIYIYVCRLMLWLWVYKGHHDVAGPPGGGKTLVVVCQAARVHEGPALPGRLHVTVVTQEPAASTLTHTHTQTQS